MKVKKIMAAMLAASLCLCFTACTPKIVDGNKPDNTDQNDPLKPDPTKPDPEDPGKDIVDDGSAIIKFNANGGAFVSGDGEVSLSASVASDRLKVKGNPRKDGYAFVGWYNGDNAFDSTAKYSNGTVFTAKYTDGAANGVYEALFDEGSTVSIDIGMSDAEWRKLNNDYVVFKDKFGDRGKSPIYRMADNVTISIESGSVKYDYYYEEVGVRMKGNTSRHEFYGNDGFFDNVHLKLSFKQTFDDIDDGYTQDELKTWDDTTARKARKDRRFGGMEKIDIKYNSTADETYVRELYAMKLFRDNGIPAPHVTMGSVTALEKNTTRKNLGVYRIHEPIDEAFLTRNFPGDDNGDLWKCTYNQSGAADMTLDYLEYKVGKEDELQNLAYAYDKKTNKKKGFDSMKNFITAINDSSPDFESLIDTDLFAKFEAVNYILGNPDCIRNNWNNYYTYFRPSDGKAVIIPYDYDRCLGLTNGWNPTGNGCTDLAPYTRWSGGANDSQRNPLYVNLIDKGAPYGEGSVLKKYQANLIALSQSNAVTSNTFNAYKNKYKQRYSSFTSSAIQTNSMAFDGQTDNISFENYMQRKLTTLNNNIDNYISNNS